MDRRRATRLHHLTHRRHLGDRPRRTRPGAWKIGWIGASTCPCGEYGCCVRGDHAPNDFNTLRQFGINWLVNARASMRTTRKRFTAAINDDFGANHLSGR